MTIELKTGDIWTTESLIIGHGVNTKGAMASGIAVQFRDKFPEMHEYYQILCKALPTERLIGTAGIWANGFYEGSGPVIANLFSQDYPGPNANYAWANKAINDAVVFAITNGFDRIALPQIGCGIGGLDWPTMLNMLEKFYSDVPVTLELWTYENPAKP